jgi:hypothetical protein
MSEILHVILLKVRSDAPPEDLDAALEAFRALNDEIDGVVEIIAGPDVSVEGLAAGHTHVLIVRLADEAARERYLPHPAHRAVGAMMQPLLDGVTVLDVAV